jgi:hypothetical protein
MHHSQCYRDNAAECLLAAQEPCQPYYRKLRLSMAISWLSLARQDEAMDNGWDMAETVKTEADPAQSLPFVSSFCRANSRHCWAISIRVAFASRAFTCEAIRSHSFALSRHCLTL